MIKNIVLDMGNVLLEFRPEYVLDTFCSSAEEKAVIRRHSFSKSTDKYELFVAEKLQVLSGQGPVLCRNQL